jgi:proteasome accessory factor A
MWEEALKALETGDVSPLNGKLDWVTKHDLIEKYRARAGVSLGHPKIALMDLAYHDVNRERGLYYLLERRGRMERVVDEARVATAMNEPPQTTRARLRGEFIKTAKERRRDFTVDWVHLKLNDQAQRTVLCKDPFKAHDERVEKLIALM